MKKSRLIGLLTACLGLAWQTSLAEGSKNLTPYKNGGNASGTNDYVGYLQHDAGTNSNDFLKPGAPDNEKMYVIVKPGETLYYGLQRIYSYYWNQYGYKANLRVRLKTFYGGTTYSLQSTILSADAGSNHGLDMTQSGVIDSYAQALAGPQQAGFTGGYDALSWTNTTNATLYVYVELTTPSGTTAASDEEGFVGTYGANSSAYNLWDFTVVDANSVERKGRLYSKQWSFTTRSYEARLSQNFSLYSAIPAIEGGYYVKKVNYFGAQPFEAIYVANSTGTDPTAPEHAAGSDYTDWRKSQYYYTSGFLSSDIYPEYELFVNDPDPEFFSTASTQAVSSVASSVFCDAAGNPRMSLNLYSSKAGVGIIHIDLNSDGVLDADDRLLEQEIVAGNNYFYWDGLDGIGNQVATGTELTFTFRSNVAAVNFPIWDVESNNNGLTVQQIRPGVKGEYEYLYYDDTNLDASAVNVDPTSQLAGNNSAAGAHRWQDLSADFSGGGNARIMNTFTYGSVETQTISFAFTYDCNPDFDSDGYTNDIDADNDNDGLADVDELNGLADPYGYDASSTTGYPRYVDHSLAGFVDYDANGIDDRYDTDGDGILNINDTDADGDGIWDAVEANLGVIPTIGGFDNATGTFTSADADNNGMVDAIESSGSTTLANPDSDGDGILDLADLDSDNDGALDTYELTADADSDGKPDYLDTDSDGDTIFDVIEVAGTDADSNGELDSFTDLNQNGLHDSYESAMGGTGLGDPDSDGDGLTNRLDLDSDNDGLSDTTEGSTDIDGDGVYNIADLDSDNDGLYDVYEAGGTAGSDGRLAGFTDADNDGMDDTTEASPLSVPNTDGTGNPDYLDADSDGDGISDVLEAGAADSDGDGHINGTVNSNGLVASIDTATGGTALTPKDTDGDGTPDYKETDSDGDGFLDAVEGFDNNYDNLADITASGTDTDGDGLDNSFDTDNGGTASTQPDLDNDGLPNYQDTDDDGDGTNSQAEGVGSGVVPAYLDNADTQFVLVTSGSSPAKQTALACYSMSTTATGNNAAAIWYSQTHDLTKSFVIEANLNFGSAINEGEGIAFVMHNNAAGTSALGSSGAGIGYNGIANSLAFEFDTDDDGAYDPGNDHFRFISNGNSSNTTNAHVDLGEIEDGLDHTFKAVYSAAANTLTITFDGVTIYQASSVTTILGTTSATYWGFTSATSTQDANNQSVCNISYELATDTDGDGTADIDDPDDDGDGINDVDESYGLDPLGDYDNDGILTYQDTNELTVWADNNGDGINDIFDIDQDGIMNHLDIDADNDGILDETEGSNDNDGDGFANNIDQDSDGDGIADIVEANGTDIDASGTIDGFYDYNNNGMADAYDPAQGNSSISPIDSDSDGVADYLDLDSDNDGIADIIELGEYDTDENGQVDNLSDINYNGWHDSFEGNALALYDLDGDGNFNHRDLDADGDGIADRVEHNQTDSDNNGIADSFTDANTDGWHDSYLYNSIEVVDWDGDGAINHLDLDSDNDGILDELEAVDDASYTSSRIIYTGSGTASARIATTFVSNLVDTDGDGIVDYNDLDSDNDGITDAVEAGGTDTDGNGMIDNFTDGSPTGGDGLDDRLAASPLAVGDTDSDGARDFRDRDSDNDGQADWIEAYDANGDLDAFPEYIQYSVDYADYTGDNPYDNTIDTDGNSIPDWMEDDDNDGYPNFQDPDNAYYLDNDNNGIVNLYDATFGGVVTKPNNEAFTDPGTVTVLPVELLYFHAKVEGDKVIIDWATASELNNSHFVVQRSADGKRFEDLDIVIGAGNSTKELSYSFIDDSPLAGISYYRLVQVDYDGNTEIFDPVSVKLQTVWQIGAYPNPSTSDEAVTLKITSEEQQYVNLEIVTLNGNIMWQSTQYIEAGVNRLELPQQAMPKTGMYILKVSNNLNSQVVKLIKK